MRGEGQCTGQVGEHKLFVVGGGEAVHGAGRGAQVVCCLGGGGQCTGQVGEHKLFGGEGRVRKAEMTWGIGIGDGEWGA